MTQDIVSLDRERRALSIVEQHVDLSPEARRDRVAELCAGDPVLLQRVERLLARATQAEGLLREDPGDWSQIERLPERIGNFRITGVLGQGGMGIVYNAERDDGLYEQAVAIKVMQSAMKSDETRVRFFLERQILARLNHPGIVRILDGGDYLGRPYLVMERCDGVPLTEYVRSRPLSLDARLALFVSICEIVQFAHRNLVVHADLKPSNIMVGDHGQMRLLDFGIARIADGDADNSSHATGFTRAYASPERRGGGPATVAGDVYSLGAILFELLCGALPERITRTQWMNPAGTATPLSHPAWTRPSEYTGVDGVAASDLRGDLDAIVGRAVAPLVDKRYPDVSALLDDLQRYLKNLPVEAHHGGLAYLARKFIARHRRGFTLTAVAGVLLAAATLFSMLQYLQAESARREADRRFFEVRGLVRHMLFDLYDELANAPGTVAARMQMADTARNTLEQLVAVDSAPADLRLDAAQSYVRLAAVLGLSGVSSLGRPGDAGKALDAAQAILDPLLAQAPDALTHATMGQVLTSRWTLLADNADSETTNRKAAEHFRQALMLNPELPQARLGWLVTEKNRGFDLLWTRDQPAQALAIFARTLEQLRAHAFELPEQRTGAQALEVQLLTRMGDAAYALEDVPAALEAYRAAESLVRAQLRQRETTALLDQLGDVLFHLSGTLADQEDQLPAALAAVTEGITVMQRVLDHGYDASAEKRLLVLLGQEADVLGRLGRPAQALERSTRSLALRQSRFDAEPENPLRRRDLAIGLGAHVDVLAAAGKSSEACAAAQRASRLWAEIRSKGQLSLRDERRSVAATASRISRHCPGV